MKKNYIYTVSNILRILKTSILLNRSNVTNILIKQKDIDLNANI